MEEMTTLWGVGRRKNAVARVRILPGKGKITINKKLLDVYFLGHEGLKIRVVEPLELTKMINKFNVFVNVKGGGISGQSGAIKHGLSRALAQLDEKTKKVLRKEGFLTRDSRMVERKKPGMPKARKKFQFSKR
ncbi:30S ribosomal protein S9 [bacterium]|nr:30S ribosomal protein S9 [bacterium]